MDSASSSSNASSRIVLNFSHTVSGRTASMIKEDLQDIRIGRSDVEDQLGLEESTISKKHIILHRIIYEQAAPISPMLYVKSLSRNVTTLRKSAPPSGNTSTFDLRRDTPPQLLENGDVLALSPTVHVQIMFPGCKSPAIRLNSLQQQEAQTFRDFYMISRLPVGHGGYGAVYMAYEKRTKRQVACKIIDLHHVSRMACEEAAEEWSKRPDRPHLSGDAERSMVKTRWLKRLRKKMEHGVAELEILKDLSHPNVVGVDAILMSDHTVYIFQELITGGDLWSYLDTYGSPGLTDADATVIVKQLIEATQYLHEHGIVHRDIKPENILMDAWEPGGRIVLSDFGLAKRMPQAQATSQMVSRRKRMHTVVGTAGYAAPEVQLHNNSEITDKGYTCAVDLWSIGAITVLLFTAQSVQDLFPVEEVDELYATNLHSMDSGEPLAGITMDDEGFYPFMATCSQRNGLPGMSQSQSTRLPALSQKLRQREDSDSPNVAGILICDLSSLKDAQHDIWGRIASAPKEFIRQLLVLNESKRMTARQALEHRWLGQPFYKDILQEVYEKAIDGWRPKEQIQIEQLPQVTNIPPPTENDSVLMKVLGQSKSQYFS